MNFNKLLKLKTEMFKTILSILNQKQNLSYPLIFRKISKYYGMKLIHTWKNGKKIYLTNEKSYYSMTIFDCQSYRDFEYCYDIDFSIICCENSTDCVNLCYFFCYICEKHIYICPYCKILLSKKKNIWKCKICHFEKIKN